VPSVDAGVLHLAQRDRALLPDAAATAWADLVDLGFTGLGGTLYASLSRAYPSRLVGRALDSAGLPGDAVVAFAAPDQWLAIFETLARR
jgi:23S rRNA (adenine-N6)-dimethyltransferase